LIDGRKENEFSNKTESGIANLTRVWQTEQDEKANTYLATSPLSL